MGSPFSKLEENRRLLVVDDEPGLIDSYRIILETQPGAAPKIVSSRSKTSTAVAAQPQVGVLCEPVYATSGEQALEILAKAHQEGRPFVGGFFDVKLGSGIDGIETIRRAKEIDPNLLCVIVTAYQDRNLDEISRLFGNDFSDHWDYLTKPFSHNEILQKARHLISDWNRRAREKNYLEQIQAQQAQLIAQERLAAVGTLARGIGHEFGNILLRLIGMAELGTQATDPKETAETFENIAKAAERAGVIVRNLQGLVRMETQRANFPVSESIEEAMPLLQHEFKKHSIEATLDLDRTLPMVFGNRVEVGQVILNLCINAIHAMGEKGGKLNIRTYRSAPPPGFSAAAEGIAIDVRDTGCGIASENLSRIFEPMFTTKGDKGSGIGLSVTTKIMTNHGGTVRVTSEVGKGTTFTLWFPSAK